MRDIKIDINRLKTNNINSTEKSSKVQTANLTHLNIEKNLKSFRQQDVRDLQSSTQNEYENHNHTNDDVANLHKQKGDMESPSQSAHRQNISQSSSFPESTERGSQRPVSPKPHSSNESPEPLSSMNTHSPPKNEVHNQLETSSKNKSFSPSSSDTPRYSNEAQESNNDDETEWIKVDHHRKKNKSMRRHNSTSQVTGAMASYDGKFKAADRTCDLYIGKVAKTVEVISIKEYIENNFNVKVLNIAILEIKTAYFNAFKVTVSANERQALFKPDKWPEGVVIDKFYNRKGKNKF